MPETYKYDSIHLAGDANASPSPITTEVGAERRDRTLGLLELVD